MHESRMNGGIGNDSRLLSVVSESEAADDDDPRPRARRLEPNTRTSP